MTGKQSYITVKRGKTERLKLPGKTIALVCFGLMSLFAICSFLGNACEQTREQLMERLKEGRKVSETNRGLKMELLAITQKAYVEFAAEERLGLKKPTEEEVVIVK